MPPQIRNFTPVLDSLVEKYGLITAAVWGRVWRYEQAADKVCRASNATLAAGLGISDRTVFRHIATLIEDGYIIDHTPTFRNKPHTLTTTQKARLEVAIEATDDGVTESQCEQSTMTESHSTMTESHSHYDRESHEESIKKQKKKQSKENGANAPHPLAPPSPQSVYLFDRLNEDRATKNRTPVTRYGTAQQRGDTDAALMKLDRAGQMQKAVDWALRNERTSRASLCNAVIAWAKNLDKPKPTHNTRANGAPNIYDVLDKLEAERER